MQRALTRMLAFACLAVGHADEPERTDAALPAITAEDILANPLDDTAYVKSARCLSTGKYRRIEIMNNQTLIFHGSRDDAWLNVLPHRCLGLQPDMILSVEQRGMRLCARDRFRGVSRFQNDVPSMPCSLGDFHHVRSENIGAIRDAFEARGRTSTVAKTVGAGERGKAAPEDPPTSE